MTSSTDATTGAEIEQMPARGPMIRLGHFAFRRRKYLFPLVFLPIVALTTRGLLLGSDRFDMWLDIAGVAVALCGQALRGAVIGLAYIVRGGRSGKIAADGLVTTGLFAHARHPLYVGNILVVIGLLLILNSIPGYLVVLPFFLITYASLVLAEEDFLRGRFGAEYDDYHRRVNRFVPSLSGIGATLRSMRFDWLRLVRKEYGSTFAWVSMAIFLRVFTDHLRHPGLPTHPSVPVALLLWGFVLTAWVIVRQLKKAKRLGSS
ncbi:MAG: methyltransferase family protein [Acidobacteriota bacterium]